MRRSLGIVAVLSSLAGCGGSESQKVDVLAASSFVDVAVPLEALIESELGIDIRFSFGSSASFFEQLNQGAPASVVLTANSETMDRLERAGLVEASTAISTNELVVVVASTDAGNRILDLADLANDDAVVVLCASSAPCGAATDELLVRAGIRVEPASREPNVRATLTKVLLGEADAAVVYRTDALATPELRSIPIDDAVNVSVTGRVAAIRGDELGAEVVAILMGTAAADVLRQAGFTSP